MKFGLMFFAASEDSLDGDKYRLIIESATFADAHGFSSVWVPERHFTKFGGLYPNPAVLHAALAMCTRTLRLNAGSLVAPLHHPMRVAEEWSVVDNLSHGRVGLSFASGWNPDDFVFFPDRYATRHDQLFDALHEVRRLWRGEPFAGINGAGQPACVTLHPAPIQPELPVWVTAAGNPQTFERAGAAGAHLLTHLLDQDEDVLASKIAIYRKARAAAGLDPAAGEVTLMLHTFVGADAADVRERARRPYCDYIKANLGLLAGLARSRGRDADLSTMSPADRDEFVNFLYERFAAERGLIGTPESCAGLVARLERIGVTEAACLLDFGPDADAILNGLPHLARLKDACAPLPASAVTAAPAARAFAPDEVLRRCTRQMSGDEFHGMLRRHGIEIDLALQMIRSVWRRDGEALAELAVGDAGGYRVHPAALDACSRVLAAALPADLFAAPAATMYVPAGMRACDVHGPLAGVVWSHAVVTESPGGGSTSFAGDIRIYDQGGHVLVEIEGLRLEPIARLRSAARSTPDATAAAETGAAVSPDRWMYERAWEQTPEVVSPKADLRGRWLIVDDAQGVGAELRHLIRAEGGVCVDPRDAGRDLRGIVYLRGLDANVDPSADAAVLRTHVDFAVHGALDLTAPGPGDRDRSAAAAPLWIVTCGAMPVGADPRAVCPAQAPLWGFGRALAVERPGALAALVDLDPAEPAGLSARRIADLIRLADSTRDGAAADASSVEDMVAFRSGERYVPRLRRLEAETSAASSLLGFGEDETFLITGGTGGLGLRLAGWLASHGARHVILVGRHALSAPAQAEVDRLAATGVDVALAYADVADYARLRAAIDRALAGRPPLAGIFHLAGVLDDGPLAQQTWERFDRVFASKVDGAWNLHRLSRDAPLTHFVLFSSVASIVPAPGQANYAAANAFLDALAHYRRAQGLSALTVNWGPWSEAGHAATEYGRRAHERLASLGIGSLAPGDALRVLEALMRRQPTQAAAVAVDWPRLFRSDPPAARLGLLAGLVRESAPGHDARAPSSALVLELRALPDDERKPYLLGHLSDLIAGALKLRTGPIDPRQRLFDLGLDSILAIDVKDRLERSLGHKLSATLLFVHPTLEALAAYILDEIVGRPAPVAAAVSPSIAALSEDELTTMLLREIDAGRGR